MSILSPKGSAKKYAVLDSVKYPFDNGLRVVGEYETIKEAESMAEGLKLSYGSMVPRPPQFRIVVVEVLSAGGNP